MQRNPIIKFVASGDFQAHEFKQFATYLPNGLNSRLANILKVFDIIKEQKEKRVLLNGDIFEESDVINVRTYTEVFKAVDNLEKDVVINVGNHDITQTLADGTVIHNLAPFKSIATVVDAPSVVWGRIGVIPYMSPPKRILEAIKWAYGEIKGHPKALILHCGVQGAKTGPKGYLVRNQIKLDDILPNKFDLILLSDYHTTQWLADNVLYMGSPIQHNFGEIHNPAIWDISLYNKKPYFKAEPIYTNLPKFIRAYPKEKDDFNALDKAAAKYWRGNYVRFDGEVEEKVVERLGKKYDFQYQISRSKEQRSSVSNIQQFNPEESIHRYVKNFGYKGRIQNNLSNLGLKLYKGEV